VISSATAITMPATAAGMIVSSIGASPCSTLVRSRTPKTITAVT